MALGLVLRREIQDWESSTEHAGHQSSVPGSKFTAELTTPGGIFPVSSLDSATSSCLPPPRYLLPGNGLHFPEVQEVTV